MLPDKNKESDVTNVPSGELITPGGSVLSLKPAEHLRSALREEVASIAPFDALERVHRADVLAWIDSGVELCRTQKPATPPKHLVSYFVLVDHDFDDGEFHSVQWFRFSEAPVSRSDPHLGRFLQKLASTRRSTPLFAMACAPISCDGRASDR